MFFLPLHHPVGAGRHSGETRGLDRPSSRLASISGLTLEDGQNPDFNCAIFNQIFVRLFVNRSHRDATLPDGWLVDDGMTSDFSAARLHLQKAYDSLCGNDRISAEARYAIDLLIEAIAAREFSRKPAEILPFKRRTRL